MTARPRTRPASALPAPTAEEEITPDTARMRRVLELTAARRTQPEIAHAIGCSERTVRNILKAARERQVQTFRSRSPEEVIADVEHKHAVQYGRWTGVWARARNANNIKAEIAALARMDQSLFGRVASLAKVGFFDNVTWNTGTGVDASAKRDRDEISALISMSAAVNRGEDMDSFTLETTDIADTFDPDDPLY